MNPGTDKPWQEYALTLVDKTGGYAVGGTGVPFSEVYHITHLRDATRIIEDGRIRSSVVWDDSVLRNTRSKVAWLSPNEFYQGSIYGNIRFVFDWEEVVGDGSLYWVEAITGVNPTAIRLLIPDELSLWLSTEDDGDRLLIPAIGGPLELPRFPHGELGGPIYHHESSGKWYRHRECTLEFMVADDLPLSRVTRIDFVNHHASICKGNACNDTGILAWQAGARFLAVCLGRDMEAATSRIDMGDPTTIAAAEEMLRRVAGPTPDVLPDASSRTVATAKAILDAWGSQRTGQFEAMSQLFSNPSALCAATITVIQEAFPDFDTASMLD